MKHTQEEAVEKLNVMLRRTVAEARGRTQKLSQRSFPSSGDIVDIPVESHHALGLLLVDMMNGGEEWYAIPVDTFSFIGIADILVPKCDDQWQTAIRCGCGTWINPKLFSTESRFDFVDDCVVLQVRRLLSELVRGTLAASDSQLVTEDDEDYIDHIDAIAKFAEDVQSWVNRSA